MAVPFNNTTCKNVATVETPNLDLDAQGLASSLANSVQELAIELNSKICSTAEEGVQRDIQIAALVSEIDARVKVLQDAEAVTGLTPEQVQVLVEASGFFLNEDGTEKDLGTIVQLLNTIDTALNLKADKSELESEVARLEGLIENVDVTIDLSNYATLDDLCTVSNSVCDKLNAFAGALVALRDGISSAFASASSAISSIVIPACTTSTFTLPTLQSASAPDGGTGGIG